MSQTGGGQPPPGRALQWVRRALKLPYSDLSLTDKSDVPMALADHFDLGLVLPYGIGPNEPRLLRVDDTGALVLSQAAGSQAGVYLVDDPTFTNTRARVAAPGDGGGTVAGPFMVAQQLLFNNGTWDRVRSASANAMGLMSGIGAALSTPPGMWSAVSNPAAGVQATATQAAGGAGVRHVATGIIITWGAIAAPVATALTWALRDGASGAGTILAQGQLAVPAAVFQGQPVQITDIAIPGTANTAMTLEFSAGLANLLEGVTLLGFDAH